MSSEAPRQLLGRPVSTHVSVSLVEQVHDILYDAILRGHWKEGERLPSISALAAESGLSRFPIQRAYDLLAHKGFLRQEGRRGTFLQSPRPEGRQKRGKIGLAVEMWPGVSGRPEPELCRFWQMHTLMEAASERGFETEVVYLPVERDWSRIDLPGEVFSSEVLGVVSTYPFSRPDFIVGETGRLPLVFLGAVLEDSLPCVTGDIWLAANLMTRKVLDAGHRDIVIATAWQENSMGRRLFWRGHTDALRRAGLEGNREAFEFLAGSHGDDFAAIREFLETFDSATAVLSMNESLGFNIVSVADLMGREVPKELSLVTRGITPMSPRDPERVLTGFHHRERRFMEKCIDTLVELLETGSCSASRIALPPVFIEGASLAPPRGKKAGLSKAKTSLSKQEAPAL